MGSSVSPYPAGPSAPCWELFPGNCFRHAFLSALNVALYGMFLAVVIPPAKTSRILTGVILASMALSLVFAHVPLLAGLSSGFKIILLTILIAGAAAILFPVKEENEHET